MLHAAASAADIAGSDEAIQIYSIVFCWDQITTGRVAKVYLERVVEICPPSTGP